MKGLKFMKTLLVSFFVFYIVVSIAYASSLSFDSGVVVGDNNYKKYHFGVEISTDYYYINPSFTIYSTDIYSRKDYTFGVGYYSNKIEVLGEYSYASQDDGYSHNSIKGEIFYYFLKDRKLEFGMGVL